MTQGKNRGSPGQARALPSLTLQSCNPRQGSRISPRAPASRGMSYPKLAEDGSVKGDALAAAFSAAMLGSLPSMGKQLDGPRQSGQTGGRGSFLLSLCFISCENDSSAACSPGADGQRGISG